MINKERDIIKKLSVESLASYFDHTQLKAYAFREDFIKLCNECKKYNFKMVAINPAPVKLCRKLLEGSGVHVGAAIGFPLGQETLETKLFSIDDAINNGANEIDYVINISELKDKNFSYIENEMNKIVLICRERNVISKVIFENCYLTQEEIIELSQIARFIEPDFIKTSTGFGTRGADANEISLMKTIVGNKVKVKAAGGIRTLEDALSMIQAGAERLGSTASVNILEEFKSTPKRPDPI